MRRLLAVAILFLFALPLGAQSVRIMTTARDCGTIYLDTPFSCQFVADGGTPPYHWTAPNLPPGLTMSDSGLLSGTVASCSATVASNCVHIPANPQGMKVLVAGQTLNLKARKHEPSKKTAGRRSNSAAA